VSNADQFGELLEAYALGALDAPERAALEAHLAANCPECAAALAEARWLVSQLAYAAPDAAPSDMLRGRLMQIVRAEAAKEAASASSELRATRAAAKPAVPYWMWVAAAALLVVAVYSTWTARQLQQQVDYTNRRAMAELDSREKIEEELAAVRREASILADPGSFKIALATSQPDLAPMQANWSPQLGIVLSGRKIQRPAGDRVLQLWLIPKAEGSKPIPSQTVRPDANGNFVLLVATPPGAMEDTKALAVTEEPAGGSPLPTTPPTWVGTTASASPTR
jgi:anti-sigma factor RsiW